MKSPVDESIFNSKVHPMINSVERDVRINRGEASEVRETPERVQIDSGAVHAADPMETARAFELKETTMSKRGVGFVAASGSWSKTMERRASLDVLRMEKELV